MNTRIEWTQKTWNPITGCSKVSEACLNCYAEVMAKRLNSMPASKHKYRNGFDVTLHPECLEEPLHWKKPSMVFVVSMGDLFHKYVPHEFIDKVFDIIQRTPLHTYQILTKRANRMWEYFTTHEVPLNVWLGVTCESRLHYDRIDWLRRIKGAKVKFLSCEPLLSDMDDMNLSGIDWVIAGGESGNRARKTDPEWFYNLQKMCIKQDVPFFFKQWGTWGSDGIKRNKHANGKLLQDKIIQQMPN